MRLAQASANVSATREPRPWKEPSHRQYSHCAPIPITLRRVDAARFDLIAPPDFKVSTLLEDARRGLQGRPRSIPPKHFYDAAGSALFDEICGLPEYYLTRAEGALLEVSARDIAARSSASELVELGSGMARKTGLLLRAMSMTAPSLVYVPFDISATALEASAEALLTVHPSLFVRAVVGDFPADLGRLSRVPRAAGAKRLFAFLGSTMGNLDEAEAPALVRAVARQMQPGDHFLLGVDLVKSDAVLHAAYNDARGVTAAFNKNVLAVMNRELGADFDLSKWDHVAHYRRDAARIEMHLVSREAQRVSVARLELALDFVAGERILTEISRKFTRPSVESTLGGGGMKLEAWYTDEAATFGLALARVSPSSP